MFAFLLTSPGSGKEFDARRGRTGRPEDTTEAQSTRGLRGVLMGGIREDTFGGT